MKNDQDISALLTFWRNKREFTVRKLAAAADISPAMISRIEKKLVSPSFATIKKILDALNLSFAEFFNASAPVTASPIIRKSDTKEVLGIGKDMTVTLLNPGRSNELQLFMEEYKPGSHSGTEMLAHKSVEAGICIEGELHLEVNGITYVVKKGESWFFDSRLPHRFSNRSKKKAALISANTPASF